MFLFGHIGITLGAAIVVNGLITTMRPFSSHHKSPHQRESKSTESQPISNKAFPITSWIESLAKFMDIRLLIIGSLLPDIIDKPLSLLGFGNGRYITHTLLITLLVLLIGLYLYINHKKTWLLTLVIGMFTHLILDSMWATPQTLLWPSYGWAFPSPVQRIGLEQINFWWNILRTNLGVDVSEAIGLVILIWLIGILAYQRKLKVFLIKGRV